MRRVSTPRVQCSLHIESAITLFHAFVMSRIDYCNSVLAGATKPVTDKLKSVLNAAARFVGGILSSIVAYHTYGTAFEPALA